MKNTKAAHMLAAMLFLVFSIGDVSAGQSIKIAVASNFTEAIKSLARRFEINTGHKIILSFGATGRHYAQIKHGAPFDAFFAADARRPELLEREGAALAGSRFTYALGKIVLWSPHPDFIGKNGQVLKTGGFRHIAIANPRLAPYGRAAKQILAGLGLWQSLRPRMVRGENIAQTFQFVKSGNAELGFVAVSQIKSPGFSGGGSMWTPPQSLYDPIAQQAVLLRENKVARAFLDFVKGREGQAIIMKFGYGVADAR